MKGVAGAESKALPTVLREMNLHLMRVDSTKNLIFCLSTGSFWDSKRKRRKNKKCEKLGNSKIKKRR
jgi:hypothetical protein